MATLVTGLVGLVPIAVGLGIAALIQIGRRGHRGKGLALGGLGAAGVWAVLIAAIIAVAANGVFSLEALGHLRQVSSTEVGTCLTKPGSIGDTWSVADCSAEHDAEIFSVQVLPAGGWPGNGELGFEADSRCAGVFSDYTGDSYYTSDYDYSFFTPDRAEWDGGDRRVVCAIVPVPFDTLVGTAAR